MMTKVINKQTGTIYEIDESKTISDMEQACPRFFKNKHGKRETFTEYRGCLIVRHTIQYTHKPVRETAVYIHCVLEKNLDMFCVSVGSSCDSIAQAKRLINRLLNGGEYYYGFYKG